MKTNRQALDALIDALDEVADRVYLDNYSQDLHRRDRSKTSHELVRIITHVKRLEHVLSRWDAWIDKPFDVDEARLNADWENPHRLEERYRDARDD